MSKKHKLIRITTVPVSLKTLLKGQLKFMKEKGFDVIAVTSDDGSIEDIATHEQVPVKTISMTRQITPLKDIIAVWNLYKWLSKEKPTIVHTHTPKAGIVGMLASWMARVPIRLHTVAGLPLLVAEGNKRKVLNFVEKLTYACATKVYPNSNELYKIILKEKFTSIKKLKVIANGSSNGINTSYFNPDIIDENLKDEIKEKYSILRDDFAFIFIGRIVGDKGINELIQAFEKLSLTNNKIKLLLVGNYEEELDPLEPTTIKTIQENPQIIHTGFQKDVRPYLAVSNALVFPSYREGFPNVVMQAGAMGLPCIVSDINGCNEIIIPEKNGYIVPVKNTEKLIHYMTALIEDDNTYQTLKTNARKLIQERYEQEVVWDALHKEYITLLEHTNTH